jgi:DNA invertase Pin-like site-specific DNA recombinase
MSTDLQLKGDSRRRQLEQSRAYAEARGLDLAEGAELEDIGVSAFKGANVHDGALGVFLDAVRSGTVKPGSYLLVESLDRLTRQQLREAQSLFLSIIEAGINVVTLADGRVYPAGTNDLVDLILSLVIMSRAHEESQTKSHRIAAAWKNKRAKAAARVPMTKWCPAWLKLADNRTHYVQIPERVEIVRGIFQDAASGIGIYATARRLNQVGVPTFDRSRGWHTSYVAKILGNRAVIGEFQPHIRENGKRVPIGEPSRDYYPAIVDEELFYRAQIAKSERRISGAGRKGAQFTNLFSGLATCAYCKSPVKLENKGAGRKRGDVPRLRWCLAKAWLPKSALALPGF